MSRSWVVLIMACLLIASAGVYYLSQSDQTISQPTLTIETGTIEKKAVARVVLFRRILFQSSHKITVLSARSSKWVRK